MGLITSERAWIDQRVYAWGSLAGQIAFIDPPDVSNVYTSGNKSEMQSKITRKIGTVFFPPQDFHLVLSQRYTFNYFNTELNMAVSSTNILISTPVNANDFYSFVWVAPTEDMDYIMRLGLSYYGDFVAENLAKKYSLVEFTEQNFVLPYQFLTRLATSEYSIGLWRRSLSRLTAISMEVEASLSVKIGFE